MPVNTTARAKLISQEASTTVIVPTTAVTSRRTSLLNAIHSAGKQSGVATKILVVVNGQRFDSTLFNELRSRKDIKVTALPVADLPDGFSRAGNSSTPSFFAFLMTMTTSCRTDSPCACGF